MNLYELEVETPPHVAAAMSGQTHFSTTLMADCDDDARVAADLWRENLALTWGTVPHVVGRVHVRTAVYCRLVWHDGGDAQGNLATLENGEYRFVGIVD